MTKILILGGIKEAAELAEKLVSQGHDVTTSLAGRTKEPSPVAGKTRIGGFGGAEGLSKFLQSEQFEKLIDCTHPFAQQISQNAQIAAAKTGIAFQTITRQEWEMQPGDKWIMVPNLEDAKQKIPPNARVLLALGSQYIDIFSSRNDVHFVIRRVDKPETRLDFTSHTLILGKPSIEVATERSMLEQHNITHIVCRNSGGNGAYAKIEAARELALPVIMIDRHQTSVTKKQET